MLIYSPRPSHGARELADALGIKQASRRTNRIYTGTCINWGSVNLPDRFRNAHIINTPEAIAEVSNKLTFFNKMKRKEICPKFTEDRDEAISWILEKKRVVARTVLAGSGGVGINISSSDSDLKHAPLYVEYIPKDSEWRVHVFNTASFGYKGLSEVIDIQKKARMLDVPDEEVNWEVRNLKGGFIYKRHDISPPDQVTEVALKCMNNLSLHFGAVDVIYDKKRNRAYVLEVNSAPGLEGTTVENYAKAFKEMLNV